LTLVIAISTPKTAWLCADRRLTAGGRVVRDDAEKLVEVNCVDGRVLIGYAGLGASLKRGTQPSEWMVRALVGTNAPLERTLAALSDAIQRRILPQLHFMDPKAPAVSHTAFAVGFLNGDARLYSIDLVLDRRGRRGLHRFTRRVGPTFVQHGQRGPLIALAGSGARSVSADRGALAHLRRVVKAHDDGRVSGNVVAEHLAAINLATHRREPTVGPRCAVFSRPRDGGGGAWAFNGRHSDPAGAGLPILNRGQNLGAVLDAIKRVAIAALEQRVPGAPLSASAFDVDVINAKLAKIPDVPDDSLE
jgi:hypothetical protein